MAGEYNFTIEQGADFTRTFTWTDAAGALVNLTTYTARMKIKTAAGGDLIASLASNANTTVPYIDVNGAAQTYTSAASGITLGGAAGTIIVTILAAGTTLMNFKRGVYDLELVSASSVVTRLLEGNVLLSKEVTT